MASHTKPPRVCYLQDGKAIGAHKDFAATFNWLVDWVWNFKVGKGLEFQQKPDSAHPVVQLEDEEAADGKVTIAGTDGSSFKGSSFVFASDPYSNVTVSVDEGTITVGVRYV